MAQTTEAVLGALAAYRAHINGGNRRAMEVIIPQIEAADEADPEVFESPEEKEEARLDFVHDLLGGRTEPPIERPSDVLDNWDAIIQQSALDGGAVNPDTEWRAGKREAYKSGILQGLSHLECPNDQWALPADFEVLMNEIDSLEGAGWYRIRAMGAIIFWEGWGVHGNYNETPEHIQQRVKDGQGIFDISDSVVREDYDVAGGWELGSGNESRCLAMYSRPKSDESQGWSWRYVASLGQFGSEIFDDLVGVLDWYKTYNEPEEEDLVIDPEVVFGPF